MNLTLTDTFLSLPPAGTLPGAELPKLLLKAGHEKFEGSLVIQDAAQNKAALRFVNGCATRWLSSSAGEIVGAVLSEMLPHEQLSFVRTHARHQQTDELSALLRLGMLPDASLRRLHRDATLRVLLSVGASASPVRYQYYAGHDYFAGRDGMNFPLDGLGLVLGYLLSTADLEWVKAEIQPLRHETLVLRGRVTNPDLDLAGPLRQLVAILRRQPTSFDTLRLRRIQPEETLVACVYALLGADGATLQRTSVSRPPITETTSLAPTERASLPAPERAASARPSSTASVPVPPRSTSTQPAAGSSVPAPARSTSTQPTAGPSVPAPRGSSYSPPQSGVVPAHTVQRSLTPSPFQSPVSSRAPTDSLSAPPSSRSSMAPQSSSSSRSTTSPRPSAQSVAPRDENAIESGAMDAWMKSVADPSCAERALQVAQRAAERFPENPRILFYFGCLLVRRGQTREAETTMRRVLKLDPDHIEAQYELRKLQRQASSQSQTRPAIMGIFGSKKSNSG